MKIYPHAPAYRHLLFLLLALVFTTVVFIRSAPAAEGAAAGAEEQQPMKLHGQFLGSSAKAQLISIQVGERIVLVPYDSDTTGLSEVMAGASVVLQYQGDGDQRKAAAILPELVAIPPGVTEIEPEELLAIINNPRADHGYLLVDCRPAEFYAETHLQTAVSIPWSSPTDEKTALLPSDRETLLIFYCLGPACLLGPNSAALAVEAGYKNVRVLLSELADWQEIGGQLFSADSYIAHGNIALVDLRGAAESATGHIPGSANVPFAELKEAEYGFPAKKAAPVVLYGDAAEVTAAVDIIRGWGFRQVSVVKGGYSGWLDRGNAIATGPSPSSVKWQRELGIGEISVEDFNEIMARNSVNAIIIDVRTNQEAARGKLPNSRHIPLSELEKRLVEVPEDREIILHCTTGARAMMAYAFLKQHREKVRFLHAKVICKDGKCRIRS